MAQITHEKVCRHIIVEELQKEICRSNFVSESGSDEAYFPHPERFDIRRSPNLHLTFGHGVHFCVGHALVCLEVRIVLERIVVRFSEIRLDL